MYITAYSKQCKEFCYGSPGSLFFIGSRFLYTWGGRFAFCYLYRKKRQDISAGSFDFASFPVAHLYRFFIVALVLSVIFPTLSYPFQNTVEFTLFFVYYPCPPFILWFIFSILSGKFLPEQIKIFLCLLMIFQTGEKKKI